MEKKVTYFLYRFDPDQQYWYIDREQTQKEFETSYLRYWNRIKRELKR